MKIKAGKEGSAKLRRALNPTPKKIGFHTTGNNSQPPNDSDILLITQIISPFV